MSVQGNGLLIYIDEPFFFHPRHFPSDGRSVGTEIVGQLNPRHGNGEGRAAGLFRLEGKIRQQLFAQGLFRDNLQLFHELGVLCGNEVQHIFDEPMMKRTGLGTDVENFLKGQGQEGRRLDGLEGD